MEKVAFNWVLMSGWDLGMLKRGVSTYNLGDSFLYLFVRVIFCILFYKFFT